MTRGLYAAFKRTFRVAHTSLPYAQIIKPRRQACTSLKFPKSTTKMATTKVKLTPLESDIFRVLLEASKACNVSVTLRVAGGWVRDKLLGMDSDDIDIALDTMLGKEFAEQVRRSHDPRGSVRFSRRK